MNKRIELSLIVGIFFIFIVSSIIPMVIGYNVRITDRELIDGDYAFYKFDECNSLKVPNLEKHFHEDYFDDDSRLNEINKNHHKRLLLVR